MTITNILGFTRKTIIDIRAHAAPEIDPVSKRSLDVLKKEGERDAYNLGRDYYSMHNGDFIAYHSDKIRAKKTVEYIVMGRQKPQKILPKVDIRLMLSMFREKDLKTPQGIPYGSEYIMEFFKLNKGYVLEAAGEICSFIRDCNYEHFAKGYQKPLFIGISHRPKIEAASGKLMGLPDSEISDLALAPLEGMRIEIESKKKSEDITLIKMHYNLRTVDVPKERLLMYDL